MFRVFLYAVLHKACSSRTLCAVLERDLCGLQILVQVEYCLYVVISNRYGDRVCLLSMLARQVHVVYAYKSFF